MVGGGDLDGPFEEFAFVEDGAGPDEGDQVRGIDRPPAGLSGVDELVGHGDPGRTRAGTLGDLRP